MGEIPPGKKTLALANTGDSALYLNSIEMSSSPGDTFPGGDLALRFRHEATGGSAAGISYLGRGKGPADTITGLGGILVPPGDSLVLDDFQVDPCFCLLKTSANIASGDRFTLLLRFNFSRAKPVGPGGPGEIRTYAWFQGKYGVTAALKPGRKGVREPAAAKSGQPRGTYMAKGRYIGLDGRPPRIDRIPASRVHSP